MSDLFKNKKKFIAGLLLITLFSTSLLAACTGRTVIDVNIDPTTGSGDIVIIPPEEEQPAPSDSDSDTENTDMSQVALFAVIVALLLGTAAIVVSVARRPRDET